MFLDFLAAKRNLSTKILNAFVTDKEEEAVAGKRGRNVEGNNIKRLES